jgi:tetratricopeptide (TPR) repeat protein
MDRCALLGCAVLALAQASAGTAHATMARAPARTTLSADQRRALEHLREGQRLLRAETFDAAAREFGQAVRLDPHLVMAHYGLGQARMGLREFPAAVEAYVGCRKAFLAVQAADTEARLAFAEARDAQARDLRDAEREIEAELRQAPPNSAVAAALSRRLQRLQNQIDAVEQLRGVELGGGGAEVPPSLSLALGSAYFRSGRFEDAEREYKAAIAVRPRFGEALNNLAVLYLETGRPAEAMDAMTRATKAGFRVHPDVRKSIQAALERR